MRMFYMVDLWFEYSRFSPSFRPKQNFRFCLAKLNFSSSRSTAGNLSRENHEIFLFVLETVYNSEDSPKKKIDDLIHLAELCIELLQQDAEHYQEAFQQYQELLIEHEEIFWSLFAVDMEHVIDQQPIDSWESFPLFQLLNDYLRTHGNYRRKIFFFFGTFSSSFRYFSRWSIPPTVTWYIRAASGSLRWFNGIMYRTIDPQRFRKRKLESQDVSDRRKTSKTNDRMEFFVSDADV